MKKNKLFIAALCVAGLMSSCVTSSYLVTDNPVGTKVGVAKLGLIGKDKDMSLEKACANGKIKNIGTVEIRTTVIIFPFTKTIVTGE
jgi:hypothetical protein